jgi:hypothetical protein
MLIIILYTPLFRSNLNYFRLIITTIIKLIYLFRLDTTTISNPSFLDILVLLRNFYLDYFIFRRRFFYFRLLRRLKIFF